MNWLVKGKTGLIILSALSLLSCDNEELLSLDFNPQDENINISFTELTLPSQLVQRDSITTSYTNNMLVGNYRSVDFGMLEARAYMGIRINSQATVEADDLLDSLVFNVRRNYFYGTASGDVQQTIRLHQLTEEIQDTIRYENTSSLSFDPVPLGQLTYNIVPGTNDTLSILLSDDLGNELLGLFRANAPETDSSALFRRYFKGMVLTAGSENSFITGFDPASIEMSLFYSAAGDTVSQKISFVVPGVLIDPRTGASGPLNFSEVQYDRSGTAIADIDEPREVGSPTDDRLYLQSSSGLISRIDMQPLLDFVESSEERILLNRVVLHIGLANEVEEGLAPPPALFGYLVEDDGYSRILSTVPNRSGSLYFHGVYSDSEFIFDQNNRRPFPVEPSAIVYDSTDVAYNLKITSFSQTLLDGYVDNSEILLFPSDFNSSITQLVTSADSVKLRVYYSRLR